ncbi:MAG: TolC family protein [Acidobacteriota bacterium]
MRFFISCRSSSILSLVGKIITINLSVFLSLLLPTWSQSVQATVAYQAEQGQPATTQSHQQEKKTNNYPQQHHATQPSSLNKSSDNVGLSESLKIESDGPSITLIQMEQMAMENNPTLAQANADIMAAQGRRRQAGLWPNPIVGYRGEELSFKAFTEKSEHFFFIEQTVLLGGKLSKSRRIFETEVTLAETEALAQRQRIINTVRMLYYEALAAQGRVELRRELVSIARDAVKTTAELLNVGQADRPDYIDSEAEALMVEQELVNAKNDFYQLWQLLVSVVGVPNMEPQRLTGDLAIDIPRLDQQTVLTTLLRDSPEIKTTRIEVERAQAILARARAERVPDLFLRGAIGYSTERLESTAGPRGRTGLEASVEIGFTLPIFNRNQGNIAAAQAELTRAQRELQRQELALRVRVAQAFRDYNNAFSAVQRFRQQILPRVQGAYTLYLTSFKKMSASYPQVLISQRTMFQMRENYLDALVKLNQATVLIQGSLLMGGLDAPTLRTSERGRVDLTGVRSGSQGSVNENGSIGNGSRNND